MGQTAGWSEQQTVPSVTEFWVTESWVAEFWVAEFWVIGETTVRVCGCGKRDHANDVTGFDQR